MGQIIWRKRLRTPARRSNDVSQVKGFVPSPEVGKHGDPVFGTHHARDAYHLFKSMDLESNLWSSALKVSTQYMHCIYFTLKLKRAVTRDEVSQDLKRTTVSVSPGSNRLAKYFHLDATTAILEQFNQTVDFGTRLEVRKGATRL